MISHSILLLLGFMTITTASNLPSLFDSVHAQSDVNPLCVIRGESEPPPPFIVLRWNTSSICDSTIDHFTHFYDIRAIVSNNTDFILFLESN
jgi:hypothetical protein